MIYHCHKVQQALGHPTAAVAADSGMAEGMVVAVPRTQAAADTESAVLDTADERSWGGSWLRKAEQEHEQPVAHGQGATEADQRYSSRAAAVNPHREQLDDLRTADPRTRKGRAGQGCGVRWESDHLGHDHSVLHHVPAAGSHKPALAGGYRFAVGRQPKAAGAEARIRSRTWLC